MTLSEGSGVTLTESGNDIAIATSGGGGIGAVLFDSTLAVDTASIDTGAGGIASGHKALEIWIIAATDNTGAVLDLYDMTVNNDTSAIYDWWHLRALGATVSGGGGNADTRWQMPCRGASVSGSLSYPGVMRISIPGYDQTTFWKVAEANSAIPDATGASFQDERIRSLGYRSTTAISRIKIAAQSTAKLKAGSRLLIVGLA